VEIKKISVLGAGTMGLGIIHVAAMGGLRVIGYDVNQASLDKADKVIRKNMGKTVELGKGARADMEAALKRISYTTVLEEAADVEMVIEVVPEILQMKIETFQKLDSICKPDTYYASNTSALSITEMAAATRRPARFIGMHFFNPVHRMKLIEVIRGMETARETVEVAFAVSRAMGKEPVEVNEYPGFVTTRMNALIGAEAFRMLENGVATARDIDKAVKLGLNHPMGPFEMYDLVGLDGRLRIQTYLCETLGERFRPSPLLVNYVKAGRLGRKSGKGIYEYDS
jgi:3-hydroxybutyryl-CoA dehydrogenase